MRLHNRTGTVSVGPEPATPKSRWARVTQVVYLLLLLAFLAYLLQLGWRYATRLDLEGQIQVQTWVLGAPQAGQVTPQVFRGQAIRRGEVLARIDPQLICEERLLEDRRLEQVPHDLRLAKAEGELLGDNASRFGVESLFTHLLERDIGLVPWSVFQRFVHIEQSRISRFGKTRSTLLLLSIDNMEQIHAQLGARAVDLFEALSSVMAGVLRDTDVATSREERFYLFLLSETDIESAEVPRERLLKRLTEVMTANLPTAPALDSQLLEVTGDIDLEAQLQGMASRVRD